MNVTEMFSDYDHIGKEFLTYLWFKIDTDPNFELSVGKKVVFSKEKDTVTIKGEESDIIVGKVAMTDEFVVSEIQLMYSNGEKNHSFSVKGEDLSLRGFKGPKVEYNDEDIDGFLLEKISYIEEAIEIMDSLFEHFIILRVNTEEWDKTVLKISDWIQEG